MRTTIDSNNRPLTGKLAIVTGGGSGIGFASAFTLACQGATVVLFGIPRELLSSAVQRLRAEGLDAYSVVGDVSDSASVRALVAEVLESHHRLDIIVNSAAIQPYGTVQTTSETDWDRVLAVNLKGVYLTAHYGIPAMKRVGGGAIVNVASVQGIACQENVAAYAASKGAVLALTRAMALDHARDGIRVNAVCPGAIDTPMLRLCAAQNKGTKTEDDVIKEWGLSHPLGRVGKPEEVGALVAFLCGPSSGFCTGGEYKVDGGLLAKLGVVDNVFDTSREGEERSGALAQRDVDVS
jgi:NAD(P)-dependent dehydrogenase (short-subunit alcohol dehydrogenase family)